MFGKVKKILGIEGVKLELIVSDKVNAEVGLVTGIVKLTSLSDANIVEGMHIELIEKYSRGRGDSKLINEYIIGRLVNKEKYSISKNDILEIPFEMEFTYVKSEMDKMGESNIFSKGLVSIAKKIRAVNSEFTVRAEVKIKGTSLNPFDTKSIILT
jgi:hypothetical protein